MAGNQEFTALNPQTVIGVTPIGSIDLVAGVPFDFTALINSSIRGLVGNVQSIWCDATRASSQVTILNDTTKQYAIFPAGSFGWQSFLATTPLRFRLRCLVNATIGLSVSSSVMPWAIHDGGLIHSPISSRRVDIVAAIADTQFLTGNSGREGFSVWNESTDTLYLLLNDGVSSLINYTVQMGPGNYFESAYRYGGEVRGIWTGTNGGARITEFL